MSIGMNILDGIGTTVSNAPFLSGAASGTFTKEAGGANPFSDLLTDSMNTVDGLQDQARTAVEGLMTGTGVDVHQAMIATEKADMAFEMALSVRNKAVQAYQQVMQMQF